MLEKEQDRVKKVQRARENALNIQMEKSAKLILKERRYESNTKRHEKLIQEDKDFMSEKFGGLNE